MNRIQAAIASLFRIPTSQNRREYAGARWDGASVSGWRTSGTSADSEIWSSLSTLRQRSWDLYRNDPNVSGALNDIVSETVGQGILLQSKVTKRRGKGLDNKINAAIEEAFNAWANNPEWCDVAGKQTFWQMQKTVLLSRLVSGEILVRFVRRRFGDSPLNLALELIEADQLDENYTNGRTGSGNRLIRMGVEVDDWNRPLAYWILPRHPGDYWQGQSYAPQRIPASEILHIHNWRGFRPGQTRGVPALHSIILQSRNLLGYQESEVVKARLQSCIGGFLENEQSDELALPQDEEGYFYQQFEPGIFEDLPPGKKFVAFNPSAPNNNMPDFLRTMQRSLARGLNTSSYLVSGDLADANYSSMRIGLLQQRKQFELLRDELNEDFNHRVFVQFLRLSSLSGYLKMPGDFEYNQPFYLRDTWVGEAWPWVDPTKDVQAKKTELEIGSTTLTKILKEKGIDIEEHFAELATEKELRQQYGLDDPMAEDTNEVQPDNDQDAPLVEGMQAVNPETPEPTTETPEAPPEEPPPLPEMRSYDDTVERPLVLPPVMQDKEDDDDDDDKNITINISINSEDLKPAIATESNEEDDDDEEDDDSDYLLLPGFTPARTLAGERKLKKKKKKKCSNGQVCGFSCISKSKTCIADMTPAQLMEHNKAKRLERREKAKAKRLAAKAAKAGGVQPISSLKTHQEAIERGKAIAGTYLEQIRPMGERMKQLNDESARLVEEYDKVRQEQITFLENAGPKSKEPYNFDKKAQSLIQKSESVLAEFDALKRQPNAFARQALEAIAKRSGVSAIDAKKIAENISLDKSLDKPGYRKDKNGNNIGEPYYHGKQGLIADATSFYLLTGGKGQMGKLIYSDDRAYASKRNDLVNIGQPDWRNNEVRRTLFHELGHHVEYQDKNAERIAREWVESRAEGPPTRLNRLVPGSKYKDDEVAIPDKFSNPYVGKVYNSGSTEVLSMGLERWSSPKSLSNHFIQDPDHVYLVIGLVSE